MITTLRAALFASMIWMSVISEERRREPMLSKRRLSDGILAAQVLGVLKKTAGTLGHARGVERQPDTLAKLSVDGEGGDR